MSEPEPPASKRLWKNPWAIGFVMGALALTILPVFQRMSLSAPPPIGSLGAWSMVDQWGKPIGSEELKGTVWIASFFFTRCPSVCPKQQEDMKKMLAHIDDLDGKIQLVSFTVDPDYDQPEVLNAYARKLGVDAGVGQKLWHFVGGSKDKMKDLVVGHFKLAMGEKTTVAIKDTTDNASIFDIAHAARFALVDQNGDVRGFWKQDDEGRGTLITAARMLAKHGPNP